MSPFEITVIPTGASTSDPEGPGPLRPRPRFLRLRIALAALLGVCLIVALLVAAFTIGTILAIVGLGFLAVTTAVFSVRRLFGLGRRGSFFISPK
jgi:hypothetical protein